MHAPDQSLGMVWILNALVSAIIRAIQRILPVTVFDGLGSRVAEVFSGFAGGLVSVADDGKCRVADAGHCACTGADPARSWSNEASRMQQICVPLPMLAGALSIGTCTRNPG